MEINEMETGDLLELYSQVKVELMKRDDKESLRHEKGIESPNNINVLLHYHVCPTPHERIYAPAVSEAVERFLEAGVLEACFEEGDDCYKTTELGRAWVRALCNTPCPMAVYMDGLGNVIE